MNLTSKRVIVALLIAAAFSGVLLKDLPWRGASSKPKLDGTGSAQELGESQVLVQGGMQSDVIDTSITDETKPDSKQVIPFGGMPADAGKPLARNSSGDRPMSSEGPVLPDPVATIASKPVVGDDPAAFAPFLSKQGNVPIGGGGLGGGGGGGGGSAGGGGGSGGGGNGGGSNGNNGQNPNSPTPEDNNNKPPSNPPVGGNDSGPDKPNHPSNPGNGDDVTPPTKPDDPSNPFEPHDPTDDFKPKDPTDEPNGPSNPLPGDPILPPPGDGPGPNNPGDTPTHSVPDSGSSVALLAAAFASIGVARKLLRTSR